MNLLKFLSMIVKSQINMFSDGNWHKSHLHSVKKYYGHKVKHGFVELKRTKHFTDP